MAKFRVMVRETYLIYQEADNPAEAADKAKSCMEDHSEQHLFMQEMQMLPIDDEEEQEWEGFQPSKDVH